MLNRSFRLGLRALLASTLLTVASIATAAQVNPDAPDTYVVRPGDTLWSIAGKFLDEPWRWREVWHSNSDVRDPDLIYPGDVLRLTMIDGVPSVGVERNGRSNPRVRVSTGNAVPVIPMSAIAPFLTRPFVADSDAIDRAPYVVGFPDEHIVAGLHDSIYVRRIDSTRISKFQVLRPGDALRDPDSNELLGYEAGFVAEAVLERPGDPAKLRVVRVEREVAIGDRVVPEVVEALPASFRPRPAPAGTRGRILMVLNGVREIGQYDVVALNRGTRDGIQPGHVLEVYAGGTKQRDEVRQGEVDWNWRGESPLSSEFWYGNDHEIAGWLRNEPSPDAPLPLHVEVRKRRATYIAPYERAGTLMVFRTFDRVSFALVMSATRAMHVEDRVAAPRP